MANQQELLSEQLGKVCVTVLYGTDSIATVSGVSYYAVHFPIQTVIADLDTGSNVTATDADLHQTYPAGTILFLNFTQIELTSGLAIVYKNDTL